MKKNFILQIALFLAVVFLAISAYSQKQFRTLGPLTEEEELRYWDQAFRDWELADGTTIWAQYMGVEKNAIILKDENQQPIILKTWELSKEDAKFQREMWKKHHGEPQGGWDEKSAQDRIDGEYREWELADGTKIWASYEAVKRNEIILRVDGKNKTFKTRELSKKDAVFQRKKWNQHLREMRKERAEKRKQR